MNSITQNHQDEELLSREALINEVAQICTDALYLSRRQTAGVAVLRRGFVDDERTAQMCEDGWLNLSEIP